MAWVLARYRSGRHTESGSATNLPAWTPELYVNRVGEFMATSWVIVRRATGKAVFETYSRDVANAVNREAYAVIPIMKYLGNLNRRIKEADGVEPLPVPIEPWDGDRASV